MVFPSFRRFSNSPSVPFFSVSGMSHSRFRRIWRTLSVLNCLALTISSSLWVRNQEVNFFSLLWRESLTLFSISTNRVLLFSWLPTLLCRRWTNRRCACLDLIGRNLSHELDRKLSFQNFDTTFSCTFNMKSCLSCRQYFPSWTHLRRP